jgi:hypothetical protein
MKDIKEEEENYKMRRMGCAMEIKIVGDDGGKGER